MQILIDSVSHVFGALAVLDNVSVCIERDEVVAFLGPSGCGKTTLLRLVGGLETPTSGSIHLRSSRERQSVAHVFQDPSLLPWRTAAGNVALPLECLGVDRSEQRRRVDRALARVKLDGFACSYPKHLSGGMRQRVSIARALVVDPSLLIMDEPLGSLDQMARADLLADLIRVRTETPYTCLYVTHNPSEAVQIAHRVVLLSERPGRVREIVPIDVPLDKRTESHPTIVAARDRIWELIRNPQ